MTRGSRPDKVSYSMALHDAGPSVLAPSVLAPPGYVLRIANIPWRYLALLQTFESFSGADTQALEACC